MKCHGVLVSRIQSLWSDGVVGGPGDARFVGFLSAGGRSAHWRAGSTGQLPESGEQ